VCRHRSGRRALATAKRLLTAHSCEVGKVSKSYSSKVVKGDVIKTTPGSGSYTAAKAVGIVESRGPKPKQHQKPKKHHKK
jgi:beta-lactam-binding protein with PASTA domain